MRNYLSGVFNAGERLFPSAWKIPEQMAMSADVSTIIPTYYRNGRLRTALKSVEDQVFRDVETIVVDDSGEAHARPIVSEFNGVTYVPLAENRGAQAARMAGLERASGQYIQFLDDDDRLFPDKLRQQVPLLIERDDIGVVYCGLTWTDGPTVLPRPKVRGNVLEEALRFDTSPCMMGTMLIERDTLNRIDLSKHNHAADDIGLKIALARITDFDYVDEVLVERGSSEESLGASHAAVEGRFDVIDEYANLYEEFPEAVRRDALAETYLVQGQMILRDAVWSPRAIASFAAAVYHSPDFSIPYVASLLSSIFGRPGYAFSRWLYSRFVLGSERHGKNM